MRPPMPPTGNPSEGVGASHLAHERDDLLLLAGALAIVPLLWRVLLGWSAGASVSGFDAMATIIPVLSELVAAGGDWSALVYRPELLGGMKVRDAIGPFPLFAWLASLGLGTTAVYNVSAFVVQALMGFLGVRAASDLATAWGARMGWVTRLIGVVLVAFMPALGWRLGYGHLTLVVGLLPFMAGIALLAAACTGTVTILLGLAALLALYCGILFTGHQLVLYGAVFGAPILFGLWWSLGRRSRALAVPACVAGVAMLLALPSFLPVLAHARSSDSPRALGRTQITYSYLTQRPVDWLASVLWTRAAIPGGQPELHHHETNVPLGPVLVLAALVPWRRSRALGWGVLASALLAILFAMNARPFSTALLALVPPLNSFRVPTRAILPLAMVLPILATAAVATHAEATSRRAMLGCLPALALFWLPPWPREIAGWVVAAALVARGGRPVTPKLPIVAVACALAAGGLGAFRDRLLPLPMADRSLEAMQDMGRRLKALRPELRSPLNRVSLGFEAEDFGPNTAFASGLAALDGYYFPSRRYIELFCALHGYEYQPNALLLRFPASEAWTRPAFALYNVGWFLERTEASQLTGRRLAPTAGAAWFSQGFEPVPSFAMLGRALLDAGGDVATRAHQRLWIVTSDPALPATLPRQVDPACTSARVVGAAPTPAGTGVRIMLDTPADCPLAIAMDFVETLQAEATDATGRTRRAILFPACGSLAGVWVPAGTRDLLVEAR
jgi:hypothetical protein